MTQFITRSHWSVFDKFLAAMVVLSLFGLPYIGQLEGKLMPVADDFRITHSESTEDGETRIWGELTVERCGCDFVSTEWYLVGLTREAHLSPIVYEPGPKIRPCGVSDFGPWRLDVPIELIGDVRAVSIHQCPVRPWRTVSPLYP